MGDRMTERALETERRHASDLLPALEELLVDLKATPADLELIAVGVGPGSYTGLRVGVATALGLVRATGAQLVGVPSVAALAYERLEVDEVGSILLDARSQQLYLATYRRTPGGVEEILAPCVTTADEVMSLLPAEGRILGDSTAADAARLDESTRERFGTCAVPGAGAVLELGRARFEEKGAMSVDEVRPLYLRPFAAATRKR